MNANPMTRRPRTIDHSRRYVTNYPPEWEPNPMSKGTKTALMIGGGAAVLGVAAYFLFFRSSSAAAASNTTGVKQTGTQTGGTYQGGVQQSFCAQGMLYDPMTRKCSSPPAQGGYHVMPGTYFGPPSQFFNQGGGGGQPTTQQIQSFQLDPNNLNPTSIQSYNTGNNPFVITTPKGQGMITGATPSGGASGSIGSASYLPINLDGTAGSVVINWTYFQSGQPDQQLTTTLTFV